MFLCASGPVRSGPKAAGSPPVEDKLVNVRQERAGRVLAQRPILQGTSPGTGISPLEGERPPGGAALPY